VAVSVRVPLHHELTMAAIRAGKPVFCEWPLGANLREAEELAGAAREHGLSTFVGLQARSDPTIRYARDLIAQGHIGEALAANLSVISQAAIERPAGRLWQGVRTNGANVMTIQGGHAIDALCYILGEFVEVSGRVRTRIPEWRNTDTGEAVPVDSPDTIAASGRVESGAEVAIQVASVPSNPSGIRLEIYGREGALLLTSNSFNIGPNQIYGARGQEPLAELTVPHSYVVAPEGTPPGQPRNVAQAYVRMADAIAGREPFEPDFDAAVARHRLLDAIERSSEEGRLVRLGG
jgi:predicted dehydrogenase